MTVDLQRLDALIDLLVDVVLREIEGEAGGRAVEQGIDQYDGEREDGTESVRKPRASAEFTAVANS
jgi:hypothetical protein